MRRDQRFQMKCYDRWGGGGGGLQFTCPYPLRFKHAHHETKGSRSGRGVRGATESLKFYLVEKHEWILEK